MAPGFKLMVIISFMLVALVLFAHFSKPISSGTTLKKATQKSGEIHNSHLFPDKRIRNTGHNFQISQNPLDIEQQPSRFSLKRRLVGHMELLVDEE